MNLTFLVKYKLLQFYIFTLLEFFIIFLYLNKFYWMKINFLQLYF